MTVRVLMMDNLFLFAPLLFQGFCCHARSACIMLTILSKSITQLRRNVVTIFSSFFLSSFTRLFILNASSVII